ncbi:MAG: 23S rRNA (guanosine(2251)-2'-O)-methyltransferase RlmB [Zetaproteobacteria bacterium]|nr:23S rRNA (guanosine(2251)-2'-O)-methyltransferase RlmB [Zetaproteobacteria bacterium]
MLAGIHAVMHALQAGSEVQELWIASSKPNPKLQQLIHKAQAKYIPINYVSREMLDQMSDGARHQGVMAKTAGQVRVGFDAWLQEIDMDAAPLVLLLDQVTDPHNMGACVRTAEAAGCAAVIVPKDGSADLNSPVVAKSACGALATIPVLTVTNLARAIEQLQAAGFWVYGLAGEGEHSIYEAKFQGANAVVMGAEGSGMRRLVREKCDQLCHIPMPGSVESLNVSVATGVALFEAIRQRKG